MEEHISEATQEAKEAVHAGMQGATEQAGAAASEMKGRGRHLFEEQKGRLADQAFHIAGALRTSADKLRQEQSGQLAQYAETAAGGIERAGDFLRQRNVDDVVSEVQNFARQRPALVYGGLFVAGIAIARLLKTPAQNKTAGRSIGSRNWEI